MAVADMRLDGGCGCAGSSAMDIWEAASYGFLDEVEELVERDPSLLDKQDKEGYTPLMHASKWGKAEVVQWLVEKGAVLDVQENGWGSTALMLATGMGTN
jgi:uncharacterized protein